MKAGCESSRWRGKALIGVAAALLLVMIPTGARGEVVTPHVVQPDIVTPHVVEPPATDGVPPGSVSADEPSGVAEVTGVEPTTQPSANSPVGDKPTLGKPQPNPPGVNCKHKPGYVCPYFCPHNAPMCELDPVPVPYLSDFVLWAFYDNAEFSPSEFLQTPHLCAGAREVAFMRDFYVDLGDTFGIGREAVLDLAYKAGFANAYFEALSMFARPDCQNYVEN